MQCEGKTHAAYTNKKSCLMALGTETGSMKTGTAASAAALQAALMASRIRLASMTSREAL